MRAVVASPPVQDGNEPRLLYQQLGFHVTIRHVWDIYWFCAVSFQECISRNENSLDALYNFTDVCL